MGRLPLTSYGALQQRQQFCWLRLHFKQLQSKRAPHRQRKRPCCQVREKSLTHTGCRSAMCILDVS
jgi:hypothetical protein